jgi:hypothetical protein
MLYIYIYIYMIYVVVVTLIIPVFIKCNVHISALVLKGTRWQVVACCVNVRIDNSLAHVILAFSDNSLCSFFFFRTLNPN